MARSKPSSGKKRRPEKAAAPAPEIDGARARQRHPARWCVSRRTAVVAMVIAAAAIVAGGLAFQFLTGWRSASSGGSSATTAATFVGSETCAGCHRAQAQLWRGSQHQLAMQHAGDKSVLGDFGDDVRAPQPFNASNALPASATTPTLSLITLPLYSHDHM